MCLPSQTDKLIASVMRINSPYKNVGNLIPKIIYDADDNPSGIFFDPDKNQLIYADFEDGKVLEQHDVIPTHIEYPDANGNYAYSDYGLVELHECDYCGEADDLSCYVYFDYVDSKEE